MTTNSANDPNSGPDLYSISLTEAKQSILNLKQTLDLPTKAFTIHAADLLQALCYNGDISAILDNCSHRYARLYLGAAINSGNLQNLELFVVPVSGAELNNPLNIIGGKDEIPDGPYISREDGNIVRTGQHVYDLIAPCPGTCDFTSELYKASIGITGVK